MKKHGMDSITGTPAYPNNMSLAMANQNINGIINGCFHSPKVPRDLRVQVI